MLGNSVSGQVLIVGPNINDNSQIGGIITVVKTILSVVSIPCTYFVRSPKRGSKNFIGIIKWITTIFSFFKICRDKSISLVHIHTAMNKSAILRDFIWVFISYSLKKKILLHLHGGTYLFKDPENKLMRVLVRKSFKKASKIIVLSAIEKSQIIELYQLKAETIEVLENAINLTEIPQMVEKPFDSNCPNIVFLGRISENKGIEDLLEALTLLRKDGVNFHFNLYGQGELEEKVISFLDEKLKNKCTFHGVVSGRLKWEALNGADIFILPSRYGEGLPMTILEAMALKKIVVATNDASIGIVIEHKLNGFIVEKYNPKSIIETIKGIIELDLIKRNDIGVCARKTIEDCYSANSYIIKLTKIYNNTIC